MIAMPDALRTARMCLRAPAAADAPALFAITGDARVTRYLEWPTHADLDDVHEFIDDVRWGWESGEDYTWLLESAANRQVIGTIACQFDAHGAELGFVIAKSFWGRGLASEAATAVLAAASDIAEVYRFWASCDVDNLACARVLEKIGMMREARLRRWSQRPNLVADGRPRDAWVYAWVR